MLVETARTTTLGAGANASPEHGKTLGRKKLKIRMRNRHIFLCTKATLPGLSQKRGCIGGATGFQTAPEKDVTMIARDHGGQSRREGLDRIFPKRGDVVYVERGKEILEPGFVVLEQSIRIRGPQKQAAAGGIPVPHIGLVQIKGIRVMGCKQGIAGES